MEDFISTISAELILINLTYFQVFENNSNRRDCDPFLETNPKFFPKKINNWQSTVEVLANLKGLVLVDMKRKMCNKVGCQWSLSKK